MIEVAAWCWECSPSNWKEWAVSILGCILMGVVGGLIGMRR